MARSWSTSRSEARGTGRPPWGRGKAKGFGVLDDVRRQRDDERGGMSGDQQRLRLHDQDRPGLAGLGAVRRVEIGEPDLAAAGVGGVDGRELGIDLHALFADPLRRRRQALCAELRLGVPVHALDRAANVGRPRHAQRLGVAAAGIRQVLRQFQ